MGTEFPKPFNHSFGINLNNLNIKSDDLKKIKKAWAEGRFIFRCVNGWDFEYFGVEIFTVTSISEAGKEAKEITKNWDDISRILEKGEIPDEWVEEAIATVSKRMEELL